MKILKANSKGINLKKGVLVLFFLAVFSFFVTINILYFKGPTIKLFGHDKEIVNIHGNYNEKGFSAKYIYFNLNNQVKVDGNVDTSNPGEYQISYSLKYKNKKYQKVRKVEVKDLIAPLITLNQNSVACPNKEFVETGYEVTDNYDKDLQDKVKVTKTKKAWFYEVEDSSGNVYSTKRTIIYEDKESPVITLNNNPINVYINSNYTEPGYVVSDNCTDNLESKVSVSGSVDTSKEGTYTLVYSVTDESGNSTQATRTVNVVSRSAFVSKAVYLTFDDGPSANITPQILDVLKEENVKATFFVNDHGRGLDYLIKRAYLEGHTIASHTMSHNFYTVYTSEDAFFNEIDGMHNIIYNITGKRNKIFRFPGGSSNTVSKYNAGIMTKLVNLADNQGYLFYDWTIDSNDAGGARTKEAIYYNVTKYMGYNSLNIVLMHDSSDKYATLGALRDIIKYGKDNGFVFLPITETTPQARHHVNN